MQHRFGTSHLDAKRFKILLRPSWLSAFLCILLSLSIVGTVIGSYQFNDSWLKVLIEEWRASLADQALVTSPDGVDTVTRLSQGVNTVLGFVIWAFIGLFAYSIVAGIMGSVHYTRRLHRELGHHNVDRNSMLRMVRLRLTVRSATLFLWFLFTVFFFNKVLFFCLLAARLAAERGLTLSGIAPALLGLGILFACFHLNTIFLRLLLLRPRLFSGADIHIS